MSNKYPKATPPGTDTSINTSSCFRMTRLHKVIAVIQNIRYSIIQGTNTHTLIKWVTCFHDKQMQKTLPNPVQFSVSFSFFPSLNPSLREKHNNQLLLFLCLALKSWICVMLSRGIENSVWYVIYTEEVWGWPWCLVETDPESDLWKAAVEALTDRRVGEPALLSNRSRSEPLVPTD